MSRFEGFVTIFDRWSMGMAGHAAGLLLDTLYYWLMRWDDLDIPEKFSDVGEKEIRTMFLGFLNIHPILWLFTLLHPYICFFFDTHSPLSTLCICYLKVVQKKVHNPAIQRRAPFVAPAQAPGFSPTSIIKVLINGLNNIEDIWR